MRKRNPFFLEFKPSPFRNFLRGAGSVVDLMPEREFRPWEKSDALALCADGLAVQNDFYSAFKKAVADLKSAESSHDGKDKKPSSGVTALSEEDADAPVTAVPPALPGKKTRINHP